DRHSSASGKNRPAAAMSPCVRHSGRPLAAHQEPPRMPSESPSFRQRVLAGETVLGTFVMMGSPAATELAARSGLDWVLIDLEHGLAGESDLLALLQAVQGTGATPVVRVERTERLRVGRALDMGALGIMAPQVSGVEEARTFA